MWSTMIEETGGNRGRDEGGKLGGVLACCAPGRVTFTGRSCVVGELHEGGMGEERRRFRGAREAQESLNVVKRKKAAEADSEIRIRERINSLGQ